MTIDTLGTATVPRPLERSPVAGTVAAPATGAFRSTTGTGTAATDKTAAGTGATSAADQAAPTHDQLTRAVAKLNQSQQATSQGLEFSIDTDTRRTVVKVVDQATKEVLRQIPTPEALDIAKALEARSTMGVLIQQTA